MSDTSEPVLSGVKVLDMGHYIAGPYAAMLLAEQGADVIKVEPPWGDPYRSQLGFIVVNRSKRAITLDLKKAEGQRIAQELAKQADVLIENFHPGVADRLGIGYETVKPLNPRLIYCTISGFGEKGPYRERPGWDPIVMATASIFADQLGQSQPPLYIVLPLPSYFAAVLAAFSITAALYAREITGRGQKIEMPLFNSILASYLLHLLDVEGKERIPYDNPQGSIPLFRYYSGGDGKWFFLGLGSLRFFVKFAVAMGHEEWLADPLFDGAPFMIMAPRNTQVITLLQNIFSTKPRDEWVEFLRANDVPCAPANPVEEFINDPQVLNNEMVIKIEEPNLGTVYEMGIPIKLMLTPGKIRGRSPSLGEHSHEILAELGLSKRKIAELQSTGVIVV